MRSRRPSRTGRSGCAAALRCPQPCRSLPRALCVQERRAGGCGRMHVTVTSVWLLVATFVDCATVGACAVFELVMRRSPDASGGRAVRAYPWRTAWADTQQSVPLDRNLSSSNSSQNHMSHRRWTRSLLQRWECVRYAERRCTRVCCRNRARRAIEWPTVSHASTPHNHPNRCYSTCARNGLWHTFCVEMCAKHVYWPWQWRW